LSKKIIIICYNYEPDQFLREPDKDNRFYTYGFGGSIARNFKKYLPPEYEIEMWRLDGYVKQYYEKIFLGIKFRIFPSIHKSNVFDFRISFTKH